MIANRCFAKGTNAKTGSDNTCYDLETAGSEGFLNLLPIYLDHVLNPTLNDSFFVTEVGASFQSKLRTYNLDKKKGPFFQFPFSHLLLEQK